jgi:fluoride exporter
MDGSDRGVDETTRPFDPDIDVQRRERSRRTASVLVAIATGGVLGAAARYGVSLAIPHSTGQIPWATLLINVTGCLLIGVLMVLILEVWVAHRLVRSFLGVGVLGGYTTFSTYAVEAEQLIAAGRPGLALAYLVGTVVAALVAVRVGVSLTRKLSGTSDKQRGGRR